MKTINIVGAGLAGSLLAHILYRSWGIAANIIDDGDPYSASRASSNLFIDNWLRKFAQEQVSTGILTLENLFKDQIDYPFHTGIASAIKVRHIGQRHILLKPHVFGKVAELNSEGCVVVDAKGQRLCYPGLVALCCGHRFRELLAGVETANIPLHVKVGHAFFIKGRLPVGQRQATLSLISPFAHQKLYQYDEETIYYADSVAVSLDSYQKRRMELQQRTLDRLSRLLGSPLRPQKVLVGYRPFLEGYDFGYGGEVLPGVWALNSGGKNGLVAYAAKATIMAEQIATRLHSEG